MIFLLELFSYNLSDVYKVHENNDKKNKSCFSYDVRFICKSCPSLRTYRF